MDELFEVEESLSPRVKWMREHGVTVSSLTTESGREVVTARRGNVITVGNSEEDAVNRIARELAKYGVKHWAAL